MALHKFELRDSQLEHNDWRFPNHIKTRPLRDLDDDDFLINHKASHATVLPLPWYRLEWNQCACAETYGGYQVRGQHMDACSTDHIPQGTSWCASQRQKDYEIQVR